MRGNCCDGLRSLSSITALVHNRCRSHHQDDCPTASSVKLSSRRRQVPPARVCALGFSSLPAGPDKVRLPDAEVNGRYFVMHHAQKHRQMDTRNRTSAMDRTHQRPPDDTPNCGSMPSSQLAPASNRARARAAATRRSDHSLQRDLQSPVRRFQRLPSGCSRNDTVQLRYGDLRTTE